MDGAALFRDLKGRRRQSEFHPARPIEPAEGMRLAINDEDTATWHATLCADRKKP